MLKVALTHPKKKKKREINGLESYIQVTVRILFCEMQLVPGGSPDPE